ncbi:SPOR domain-containing protein [Endozoicomonas sp. 2B-B]
MSARVLFMEKNIRLGVVATLATLTAFSADALLLPPKPLTLSSSWDCRSDQNSDWLCRSSQTDRYEQSLETAAYSASNRNNGYPETISQQHYEPVKAEPDNQFKQEFVQPDYPRQGNNYSYTYQQTTPEQQLRQRVNELMGSEHGSFVIQWLATHTEEPLRDLQRRFPVLQQATIVRYQRKNKDWFLLLDGPFKDSQSAMTALNSPPRLLLTDKLYPWTRSLASIQKLNLIMPGELRDPGDPSQPLNEQRYAYNNPVKPDNNRLFASIAPAYPKLQQQETHRDYNVDSQQTSEPPFHSSYQSEPYKEPMDLNYSAPRSQRYTRTTPEKEDFQTKLHYQQSYLNEGYSTYSVQEKTNEYRRPKEAREYQQPARHDILKASRHSYAIQWLTGTRRDTLERVRRRYAQLSDTQIIHYRKGYQDWFLLVGPPYTSKDQANRALSSPELARISIRLSPRVRSVNELQSLITGKSEKTQQITSRKVTQPQGTIFSGPGNSYTIQWFSANKPEAIEKLKKRFPELKSAVTARYRKNQKDWYVLLQGQFTSSKEALAVLNSPQLKDAVQVLYPWTRSVKSLKKLQARES